MGIKKYFFPDTWKRRVMVRRRVRMMMRHNMRPFTFFRSFRCASRKRLEFGSIKFYPCQEGG
jgi:hypothetical protein